MGVLRDDVDGGEGMTMLTGTPVTTNSKCGSPHLTALDGIIAGELDIKTQRVPVALIMEQVVILWFELDWLCS